MRKTVPCVRTLLVAFTVVIISLATALAYPTDAMAAATRSHSYTVSGAYTDTCKLKSCTSWASRTEFTVGTYSLRTHGSVSLTDGRIFGHRATYFRTSTTRLRIDGGSSTYSATPSEFGALAGKDKACTVVYRKVKHKWQQWSIISTYYTSVGNTRIPHHIWGWANRSRTYAVADRATVKRH